MYNDIAFLGLVPFMLLLYHRHSIFMGLVPVFRTTFLGLVHVFCTTFSWALCLFVHFILT